MKIEKIEKGDLAPHTDLAVTKKVIWETDKYGFRTSGTKTAYDIVIVGDSNITGSGLTQEDTLSEMLERRLGLSVYPYAPSTIENFLRDKRFVSDMPKIVIFSSIERSLPDLKAPALSDLEAETKPSKNIFSSAMERFKSDTPLTSLVNLFDQSFDPRIIEYLLRQITHVSPPPLYKYASGNTLFLQGDAANADIPAAQVQEVADSIERYSDAFKQIGARMIFLPIPNKENIYYEMLPSKKKPLFLGDLISEVRARGIDIVDLQEYFRNAYEKNGQALYHADDTHWNASGVNIAADAIADYLIKNP
jgi:hypothetical protein